MVPTDNGYYKLIAKHSGKLVEVSGFSTTNGGNVQQWTDVNQTSGQWKLVSTSSMRVGVQEQQIHESTEDEFSLYPNPVNTTLYIDGADAASIIKIYNTVGHCVLSASGTSAEVKDLSPGIYFLRVTAGTTDHKYKLIKQ